MAFAYFLFEAAGRICFVVLSQCLAFEAAAWGESSIVIPSGFQLSVIKLLKHVCVLNGYENKLLMFTCLASSPLWSPVKGCREQQLSVLLAVPSGVLASDLWVLRFSGEPLRELKPAAWASGDGFIMERARLQPPEPWVFCVGF